MIYMKHTHTHKHHIESPCIGTVGSNCHDLDTHRPGGHLGHDEEHDHDKQAWKKTQILIVSCVDIIHILFICLCIH